MIDGMTGTENGGIAGDMTGGDAIRRKIEALATTLSLPTVRRALGTLEGEHPSHRRFGSDDIMDIRPYEPGDEARRIDWHTSARSGRPMVVHRQRRVTSRVWMLMDTGREMTGSCESGEMAWQVAANGLRMFAALSLRRSDDISLVCADSASITRVPFHGGFAQFEHTLDRALERPWNHPRNMDALLDYARRINDRNALIVLATDEHALGERQLGAIHALARTHPMVIVDVETINPFAARQRTVADADTGRRLPAFLIDAVSKREVDTHRSYLAAQLEAQLHAGGSTLMRASSSEAMFRTFVRTVSVTLARTGFSTHPVAPPKALDAAGKAGDRL